MKNTKQMNQSGNEPGTNETLVREYREGSREALEELCARNRGLVMHFARKYAGLYGNRLSAEELCSAGYLGLLKAADRFDAGLGFTFANYASWWIRAAVFHEIAAHGYSVQIPDGQHVTLIRVLKAESEMINRNVPETDLPRAIAEALKQTSSPLSENAVRNYLAMRDTMLHFQSLDQPVGKDTELTLAEILPDDSPNNSEARMNRVCLKKDLEKWMTCLTPRERLILENRYGLNGRDKMTLDETGVLLNVSRERVRQIELRALRKLRGPVVTEGLDVYGE